MTTGNNQDEQRKFKVQYFFLSCPNNSLSLSLFILSFVGSWKEEEGDGKGKFINKRYKSVYLLTFSICIVPIRFSSLPLFVSIYPSQDRKGKGGGDDRKYGAKRYVILCFAFSLLQIKMHQLFYSVARLTARPPRGRRTRGGGRAGTMVAGGEEPGDGCRGGGDSEQRQHPDC